MKKHHHQPNLCRISNGEAAGWQTCCEADRLEMGVTIKHEQNKTLTIKSRYCGAKITI